MKFTMKYPRYKDEKSIECQGIDMKFTMKYPRYKNEKSIESARE